MAVAVRVGAVSLVDGAQPDAADASHAIDATDRETHELGRSRKAVIAGGYAGRVRWFPMSSLTSFPPASRFASRSVSVSALSLVAAMSSLLSLAACATEGVETRKQCNHHCSVVYETCSERSLGGNTLNNCGYDDVRCNAMCPSK